jgi:hypothetical protein
VQLLTQVPSQWQAAARGDKRAVDEAGAAFAAMDERDPQKPWAARALAAQGNAAAKVWLDRLDQAAATVVARGAVVAEPTNIRGAKQGYNWGPAARRSDIVRALGVEPGRLGFGADDAVAERWYNCDDPLYPSWLRVDDVWLPLFWLIERHAVQVLGQAHVEAFGPAVGMVMKELDAAQALSWQLHIGIEEGYEVMHMPEGTGLFLCVNEPGDAAVRRHLIAHARSMLRALDPRVLRLREPRDGVETPAALADGLEALVDRLTDGMNDSMTVADVVERLMLDGINVVDIAGFGVTEDGRFDPRNSLIQIERPLPGSRVVTRQGRSHALFGNVAGYGPSATGWFKEFKGTALGERWNTTPTGDQTWSLSDVFLGKQPRPHKVTRAKVEEALAVMKREKAWRPLHVGDYAPRGDDEPRPVCDGVRQQRLHEEEQYSALKMWLAPGRSATLQRHGRHSAFVVTQGRIRIKRADSGAEIMASLGLDGRAWDGVASDEALVSAHVGDVVIESMGDDEAVVYDAIRPVPGVPLPTLD